MQAHSSLRPGAATFLPFERGCSVCNCKGIRVRVRAEGLQQQVQQQRHDEEKERENRKEEVEAVARPDATEAMANGLRFGLGAWVTSLLILDCGVMYVEDEKHGWLLPLLVLASLFFAAIFGFVTGLLNGVERLLTETGMLKSAADSLVAALPEDFTKQDRQMGESAAAAWERAKGSMAEKVLIGDGIQGMAGRTALGLLVQGIPVGQVLDEASRTVQTTEQSGDKTVRFSRQVTSLMEAFIRGRIGDIASIIAVIGVLLVAAAIGALVAFDQFV